MCVYGWMLVCSRNNGAPLWGFFLLPAVAPQSDLQRLTLHQNVVLLLQPPELWHVCVVNPPYASVLVPREVRCPTIGEEQSLQAAYALHFRHPQNVAACLLLAQPARQATQCRRSSCDQSHNTANKRILRKERVGSQSVNT